MSAACFKAAIPEPFRILGLRMKPLSLGRYRLLHRFNVGFVADETRKFEMGDLILGVLICAQRVDEFLEWIETPGFQDDVARWSEKVCPRSIQARVPGWIGRRWRKKHSFNIVEKLDLFKRYIQEGSEIPKFWDESGGQSSSGSHWSHGMEVGLRSELGWSAEEINEQPLSKAISDYLKFLENSGQVRFMSPEEIAQGEANAKRIEEMEKETSNSKLQTPGKFQTEKAQNEVGDSRELVLPKERI